MNCTRILIETVVILYVLMIIVSPASAGFNDVIGMQTNIKSFNEPMNKITTPLPLEINYADNLIDLKGFQRKMINSLPDPAMDYNAISAVEDIVKYQDIAIDTSSLFVGREYNPLFKAIKMPMEYVKIELDLLKNDVLKPKIYDIDYNFRDYGISGSGNMNIDQKWMPGGDFGTIERNIKQWSTYHKEIPDPGFSRSFNYQIKPIPTSNYRTYSNFNSFR